MSAGPLFECKDTEAEETNGPKISVTDGTDGKK